MTLKADREVRVSSAMQDIRSILSADGVNRDALDKVKDTVIALSRHRELFNEADFPSPTTQEGARLYLVSEDEGEVYSLYLVSVVPGGASPPHDHTTWAVIAGLAGEEENTVYRRLDDGSVTGKGEIEEDFKVIVKDGDGIAFMPEDVHHIRTVSDLPTRHLHLYGRGFNQQIGKVTFDIDQGTTTLMPTSMLPVDETQRIQPDLQR